MSLLSRHKGKPNGIFLLKIQRYLFTLGTGIQQLDLFCEMLFKMPKGSMNTKSTSKGYTYNKYFYQRLPITIYQLQSFNTAPNTLNMQNICFAFTWLNKYKILLESL